MHPEEVVDENSCRRFIPGIAWSTFQVNPKVSPRTTFTKLGVETLKVMWRDCIFQAVTSGQRQQMRSNFFLQSVSCWLNTEKRENSLKADFRMAIVS